MHASLIAASAICPSLASILACDCPLLPMSSVLGLVWLHGFPFFRKLGWLAALGLLGSLRLGVLAEESYQ